MEKEDLRPPRRASNIDAFPDPDRTTRIVLKVLRAAGSIVIFSRGSDGGRGLGQTEPASDSFTSRPFRKGSPGWASRSSLTQKWIVRDATAANSCQGTVEGRRSRPAREDGVKGCPSQIGGFFCAIQEAPDKGGNPGSCVRETENLCLHRSSSGTGEPAAYSSKPPSKGFPIGSADDQAFSSASTMRQASSDSSALMKSVESPESASVMRRS